MGRYKPKAFHAYESYRQRWSCPQHSHLRFCIIRAKRMWNCYYLRNLHFATVVIRNKCSYNEKNKEIFNKSTNLQSHLMVTKSN